MGEIALFSAIAAYWYIWLIIGILLIIANWMIFTKAGEPGWKSIIPLYNTYIQYKIAWGNGWLFLLNIIPIVNIVISIVFEVKLAKAFGKGKALGKAGQTKGKGAGSQKENHGLLPPDGLHADEKGGQFRCQYRGPGDRKKDRPGPVRHQAVK